MLNFSLHQCRRRVAVNAECSNRISRATCDGAHCDSSVPTVTQERVLSHSNSMNGYPTLGLKTPDLVEGFDHFLVSKVGLAEFVWR